MENKHSLRIMINSNAPWSPSGYSNVMDELVPLISAEGYPLALINYYGLQGGIVEVKKYPGVIQYPTINHVYGSDGMVLHAQDFKADVVFSLTDQWVLNPTDLQKVNHWIPITPIDYDPVPKGILQNLRLAYRVITYSKFGHKQLLDNGIYSTYIPHTVNTEIFKPMDKAERKKKAGLPPDSFLVGMVAANKDFPPRKSFQEVMDAFKEFIKIEPKALLYIHSNPDFPGGFPFHQYADFLGIRDRLLIPDVYQINFKTTKEDMALIYNSFDVFVMPSWSEGFGLGIIESQACGVPAIVNSFTSMPELIIEGETGYATEVLQRKWMQNQSYCGIPSTKSIYDSLVKVHKQDRVKMGIRAREFMVKDYDTHKIFKEKWIPYFQALEDELVAKEVKKE